MKIEKRTEINDSIFEELRKKHPVKSEQGVCYAQSMDYITLEVEAFNNSTFRKLVKNDSRVLIVYMYLRERMCHNGWYVTWDTNTSEDIVERLTLWGVSENDSASIISILVDNGVIKRFRQNDIECLTDVQQIYNWEMLQAKRSRDRKSKQNKASKQTNNETNQQVPVNVSEQPYEQRPEELDIEYYNQQINSNYIDTDTIELPF